MVIYTPFIKIRSELSELILIIYTLQKLASYLLTLMLAYDSAILLTFLQKAGTLSDRTESLLLARVLLKLYAYEALINS